MGCSTRVGETPSTLSEGSGKWGVLSAPTLPPPVLLPPFYLWVSSPPADKWGAEEVAAWLEALGLGEYRDIFVRHDIQGSELILLERRDLKVPLLSRPPRQTLVPGSILKILGSFLSSPQDLGITKVGHMKRILQAIKELSNPP